MAIKVTLGATENTQQEKPFPKLMIASKGIWIGNVCFFEKHMEGMLIGPEEFGYASNFNMGDFEDYNEPITLQNQ